MRFGAQLQSRIFAGQNPVWPLARANSASKLLQLQVVRSAFCHTHTRIADLHPSR